VVYDTAATGATEEYNGATWASNPTGLNTARYALAGCGTQTAGLAFGGNLPGPDTGATEEYNGSTWTTSPGSLNTARNYLAGAGIQTAALAFGGGEHLLQEQLKNIMEQLGQILHASLATAKVCSRRMQELKQLH
jgi:hypothetical protein